MADDRFHGIAVYKDKGNGCLNGTWTNTGTIGQLMNECARKKDDTNDCEDICGEYYMSYIEPDGVTINGTLKVTKNGFTYIFDWYTDAGINIFTGIGLESGKSHYSVSFIKVP